MKRTPALVLTGARVIAVEPLAEMRRVLEQAVPQAEALEGTAEAMPLPDASVDAVTMLAVEPARVERAFAEARRAADEAGVALRLPNMAKRGPRGEIVSILHLSNSKIS